MTDPVIHDVGVSFTVYPDEMRTILKVLNRATAEIEMTDEELNVLFSFRDDFASLTLEHAI